MSTVHIDDGKDEDITAVVYDEPSVLAMLITDGYAFAKKLTHIRLSLIQSEEAHLRVTFNFSSKTHYIWYLELSHWTSLLSSQMLEPSHLCWTHQPYMLSSSNLQFN